MFTRPGWNHDPALAVAGKTERAIAASKADWHRGVNASLRIEPPGALLGRRLICLVQSDNPSLSLRRIGMWTLPWFDHEQASVIAKS